MFCIHVNIWPVRVTDDEGREARRAYPLERSRIRENHCEAVFTQFLNRGHGAGQLEPPEGRWVKPEAGRDLNLGYPWSERRAPAIRLRRVYSPFGRQKTHVNGNCCRLVIIVGGKKDLDRVAKLICIVVRLDGNRRLRGGRDRQQCKEREDDEYSCSHVCLLLRKSMFLAPGPGGNAAINTQH